MYQSHMSSLLSTFGISFLLSLTGIFFTNKRFFLGISYHLLFCDLYSKFVPYQLFLSTTTVSILHCSCSGYSLQILLSTIILVLSVLLLHTPISYSYQILVTGSCCYLLLYQLLLIIPANLMNQYFQLLFSDISIRKHYHILLSATHISYSCQVLLSFTLIYSYLLLVTLMYIQKYEIGSKKKK